MCKKNILITVSGGATSGFMAVYLKELYSKENLLFLYANTGKEKEETLVFLDKLQRNFSIPLVWVEAKVHPKKGISTTFKKTNFKNCSRNGEPFREVVQKYGLPSKLYRHCTRELKERPIHKYAKHFFRDSYLTALGIRADEPHRLSKNKNYIYPLAEASIDLRFINLWWKKQTFSLGLKEYEGNCDFCFLKSKKKRVLLLREGLNVNWWQKLEHDFKSDRQPMLDVRNNLSIIDLKRISRQKKMQLSLIDDVGFGCYCSNT